MARRSVFLADVRGSIVDVWAFGGPNCDANGGFRCAKEAPASGDSSGGAGRLVEVFPSNEAAARPPTALRGGVTLLPFLAVTVGCGDGRKHSNGGLGPLAPRLVVQGLTSLSLLGVRRPARGGPILDSRSSDIGTGEEGKRTARRESVGSSEGP